MIKFFLGILFIVFVLGCSPAEETPTFSKTHSQQMLEEGLTYLAQGNVGEALEVFQVVAMTDPNNTEVYFILAQIYMRVGSFENAIAAAQEILMRDPQNGAAYLLIAASQDMMGQRQKAIESVKVAILAYQEKKDAEGLQRSLDLLEQLSETLSLEDQI